VQPAQVATILDNMVVPTVNSSIISKTLIFANLATVQKKLVKIVASATLNLI